MIISVLTDLSSELKASEIESRKKELQELKLAVLRAHCQKRNLKKSENIFVDTLLNFDSWQ